MNRREMLKAFVAAMVAPAFPVGATPVPHRIPDGTTHGYGKTLPPAVHTMHMLLGPPGKQRLIPVCRILPGGYMRPLAPDERRRSREMLRELHKGKNHV